MKTLGMARPAVDYSAARSRSNWDEAGRFSEAGFRKQLDHDYAFKWEQFGSDREQLRRAWSEYSRPGGLCEQVDTWLAAK